MNAEMVSLNPKTETNICEVCKGQRHQNKLKHPITGTDVKKDERCETMHLEDGGAGKVLEI